MILILLAAVMLVSLVLFLCKRNREAGLLLALCTTLSIEWVGVLMYIAKKGGIAQDMQVLLFLTPQIRRWMQYALVTLGQLGYMVALGRYLFPLVLIWAAVHYTMTPNLRRQRGLKLAAMVLPAVSLVVYYPTVFETLTSRYHWVLPLCVKLSLGWTISYVLLAAIMLLREYFAISMPFWRRLFRKKCAMILSMAVLYVLYCPQDPAQIYLFYRNEYMGMTQGLWYLSPALSVVNYVIVFALVLICAAIGFTTMVRYMQDSLREDREEVAIQRKFDAVGTGASVFVHSIKNQLLANRVLHKRIAQLMDAPEVDMDKLREYLLALRKANETMLERMEELYQGVKSNSILLQPIAAAEVGRAAMERFKRKYPEGRVLMEIPENIQVLCDKVHLAEAVYNLLVNGWEAQLSAGKEDESVRLICHQERLWTVLEIRDSGVGVSAAKRRKIFEPFYSEKNSNYNWGMGLTYVRAIVKSHFGVLRMESQLGKGSSFFIQLPKYTTGKEANGRANPGAGGRGL